MTFLSQKPRMQEADLPPPPLLARGTELLVEIQEASPSLNDMQETGPCFYCGVEASHCPSCPTPSCPVHLPIHRPAASCLPFTVTCLEGKGRVAVASRALRPGECVLEDTPVAVVPEWKAGRCAVCFQPCSSSCASCPLRLCCGEEEHQEECQFLRKWSGEPGPRLDLALAVLRLARGQREPEVEALMDHLEERRGQGSWSDLLTGVVRPLATCGVGQERLERLLGVFLTNCVAAGPGTVGLFPVFSLLSHSCLANTRRVSEGGRVRVVACRPVEAGEELTTSYKSPELGSVARRGHFPVTWFFDCSCPRSAGHLASYN